MQTKIKIYLEKPLKLPVSYHHILQAAIYASVKNNEQLSMLHDTGKFAGKRSFKLFTFGPIIGKYTVKSKYITFYNEIEIEVRSINQDFIRALVSYFQENGIRFGNDIFTNIEFAVADYHIDEEDIAIKMISPVCTHETGKDGSTYFFKPDEIGFYQRIEENFKRKYSAYKNTDELNSISFSQIHVTERDKYITYYKDFLIEAYKGKYRIKGKPEYLDFLYQVGLGEKNSQGFGMFDIAE